MSGLVLLIGDNPQSCEPLLQGLKADGYNVLPVRTLPEALPHLRNPALLIPAVVSNVGMRRQADLDTILEICASRPHLALILAVDELHDLHSEFRTSVRGLHILKTPLGHEDSHRYIREAIDASTSRHFAQSDVEPSHLQANDLSSPGTLHYSESFLSRVGMADVPVLLHGETGVGKEVMARRLCAYSARADKPFLKLNCAALPSELIESELFGYEKGAFTGATIDKPGKFELAQGGTILLDEIGDMDIRLQAKLLQVLQDGEVQPLGSRRIVKVDVRVMAATHRDLRKGIEDGAFREDLYYRLNVINIVIPPLRERRDEIIPLAETLLRRHLPSGAVLPVITPELQDAMLAYSWPGNVREVENVMRRFLVYQDAHVLARELTRLSAAIATAEEKIPAHATANGKSNGNGNGAANVVTMDHLERSSREAEARLLLDALGATRWNRRQAAAQLNIDYKAFLYKLQKYGIVEKAKRSQVSA
ncbi:MAG: sigma-54-dependent Fis family transcriptional regulator [Silvibacterium sp.]|nr:sigma-54-dependent Fis family transcriptional regulator [Silvibacterium sp.]